MEITKEEIKKRFLEYNEKYFDGILKTPRFGINTWNTGIIGSFRNGHDKNGKPVDPEIRIAKYADFTEETLKGIIIHEMIHYYVVFHEGYDGWFSHGRRFRRVRRYLCEYFGLKIPMNGKHIKYKNEKKR